MAAAAERETLDERIRKAKDLHKDIVLSNGVTRDTKVCIGREYGDGITIETHDRGSTDRKAMLILGFGVACLAAIALKKR